MNFVWMTIVSGGSLLLLGVGLLIWSLCAMAKASQETERDW